MVRYEAAGNAAAPAELMAQLAQDPAKQVREAVAYKADALPAVLAKLAEDQATAVRLVVARSTGTPPAALARLIRDPAERVRKETTHNPNSLLEDFSRAGTAVQQLADFAPGSIGPAAIPALNCGPQR